MSEYDLDLSLGAREFVGVKGLQPANQGQPNVKPASRAHELMTPITTGDGCQRITSVSFIYLEHRPSLARLTEPNLAPQLKLSTKSFDSEAAAIVKTALASLQVFNDPR